MVPVTWELISLTIYRMNTDNAWTGKDEYVNFFVNQWYCEYRFKKQRDSLT